ncbi:hypothetical protein [Streptomyces rubiginosohelvolus]|uniref:hypothetical protein n=1 Tax=Streptomyces rubiginosohelvolus TaxID=67362 RepID=UPI003719085C
MATETMTAQELTDLRLGTLDTAVTDWETMSKRLKTLSTGEGGGVNAKRLQTEANAADWDGVNATVTKSFVTKTAVEFQDVAGQATSVLGILRDASAAFKKHKADLRTVIDDVAKRNIYINAKGGAVASVPSGAAAGNGDIPTPSDEELAVAERRVKRVLWEASETDRIAARALRALARNKHDFTGDGPGGLKEADDRQGKADADYWAKRVKESDPSEWSDKEIERFNKTLIDQRDNPGFSERFATTLGADGTMQFWRDIADPGQGKTPEGERAKILGQLQQNLSMSLATASHVDSPAMDTWKKEVIASGGKQFGHEGIMAKPYGFQIMSNLMVKGEFGSAFLDDYGTAIRTFEQSKGSQFNPAAVWGNPGIAAQLDYTGKGGTPGSDPMAGYLKAVSHNPDFATDLFLKQLPDDSDDPNAPTRTMADYLLSEREFYDEDDPFGKGDGTMQSRDALGKALLAAGTGMNPDVPAMVTDYDRTPEQREVLDKSLGLLADKKDDFPPELRDDMAALLANHGDKVHQSASSLDSGDSTLDYEDLLQVSKQVSRDQDAYGLLMEGVNQAIIADMHAPHEGDPKEELLRAGQTVGFMESARYHALDTDKDDPSWPAKWAYHGAGGAVNFIPVVGDALQRGVDAGAYAWQVEEQARIDDKLAIDKSENFQSRQAYLTALGEEWSRVNPDHKLSATGDEYLRQMDISLAALNGNKSANGTVGSS